jgi:uncharacterized protein YndB with AHSA1/START domain/predicted enzyme related to lactoylglutathione lyase
VIRSVDPLISLPATDPARAFRFYTDVLGLAPLYENRESGFFIFGGSGYREGAPTVGIHKHEGTIASPTQQGVWCWLDVESIESSRDRLEHAGVRFLGDVEPYGPGFQVAFLDSEGNVLRLWQQIQEVRRSVDIDVRPESVFRAITEPELIERWFASIDDVRLDARVGGTVSFTDPLFGRVTGRVTALDAPHRLAIEFAENWPTHLELTVTARGRGSRLEVHQYGFDAIRDRDFGIPGLIEHLDVALSVLQRLAEVSAEAAIAGSMVLDFVRDATGGGKEAVPARE